MYVPITVPPLTAAIIAAAAFAPNGARLPRAKRWLNASAAVGLLGVVFHAYGLQRNFGAWRNWTQNLLQGPPLPAPPSFSGIALAGLAGVTLLEHAASGATHE